MTTPYRKVQRIGFLVFLSVFIPSLSLAATGEIIKRELRAEPSRQYVLPGNVPNYPKADRKTIKSYFSCYDAYTGELLTCKFTHKFLGMLEPQNNAENNGGHFHYNNRPLTLLDLPLEYLFDQDDTPYNVAGETVLPPLINAAIINHLSAIAGNSFSDSILNTAPGWICVGRCWTHTSTRYQVTNNVGYHDLIRMPVPGADDHYVLVCGADTNHIDEYAFYGKEHTTSTLSDIADLYFEINARILSINDISLLKGGVFDTRENWVNPHQTHQSGTDADINRTSSGVAVNCRNDFDLLLAVDMNLDGIQRADTSTHGFVTALYCEAGGRKHIDFDY